MKAKGAKYHAVANEELAMRVLDLNRADVFLGATEVVLHAIENFLGAEKLPEYAHTDPIKQDGLYIMFSRNHPKAQEIMEKFEATVERLKAEGRM